MTGNGERPPSPDSAQPVEPESHCTEPVDGIGHCTTTMTSPATTGGGGVDVEALIDEARAQLELPEPAIGSAPPMGGDMVVRFPVWLWIEPEQWEPRTADVSVDGGSASVTATPREVIWDMGDGTDVTCSGPGTVYDPAVHTAGDASPDCGHSYELSSKNRPGAEDTVQTRVVWDVAWESSTGEGGELEPMETAADRGVEVVEVHSLVVEG
ncbi:hypothetical protein [Streptomonospora salina]|uniref:PKD domain-containing protein n=1 Tax=Streptomonospora salina TaxID=104205 RepID=A0A841E612_9ACTN|nr:hypothetical protein [Streptomonospora salina]MBB5998446.1 hypothetical protein [Streptomonospora salina]